MKSVAFNSGYKHILLEAPTGFGKSPVVAGNDHGSSYSMHLLKTYKHSIQEIFVSESSQRE
jgi:hypothetical protein